MITLSFLKRKENPTLKTTNSNSNSNTYWMINMWYKLFWALLLVNPVNPQNNALRWVLLSSGFYKWGNQGMENWSHLARSHGWDVEELQFQPWDSGSRVCALSHVTWHEGNGPILQRRRLRLRKMKSPAQDITTWRRRDWGETLAG